MPSSLNMRMVSACSSRPPEWITASLSPGGAIARSRSSGWSTIISTLVPASRTCLSHLVNSGMCRQTSMSAACSASSVPLQAPTVATPTEVQLGTALTHIS